MHRARCQHSSVEYEDWSIVYDSTTMNDDEGRNESPQPNLARRGDCNGTYPTDGLNGCLPIHPPWNRASPSPSIPHCSPPFCAACPARSLAQFRSQQQQGREEVSGIPASKTIMRTVFSTGGRMRVSFQPILQLNSHCTPLCHL